MSRELNHKIFSPTDCLSEQTMFDYIDNKLTDKESHLVEKHLLGCELCSDAMEGLEMLKNRNRINLINQKINERITPVVQKETKIISINYRMISGIAAGLLLLIGGVFFFNNFVNKEMKQSDVAELKEPPPSLTPPVEKTVTDSEEFKPSAGKDKKGKLEPEKTEQQNQLAFAKEEKPSPDYKTTLSNAEKGVSENLKQEMVITKSDEDKNEINIPVQTDDSKIVLLEKQKEVAADETKEKAKESIGGVAGGYVNIQPTSPAKTNEVESNTVTRKIRKGETKNETSDNRFRHEAEGKKDKANKEEDKQIVVTGNVTSAPQSAAGAYEQKAQTTVSTTTESTGMPDSISANINIEPIAVFPGGKDSLLKFVKNNFNYPSGYYTWNTNSGTKITVEFMVDETGKVTQPKIVKGVNSELDTEALRVVNSLPKWKPAMDNGKPVASKYILPIELDISTNAKQTKKK